MNLKHAIFLLAVLALIVIPSAEGTPSPSGILNVIVPQSESNYAVPQGLQTGNFTTLTCNTGTAMNRIPCVDLWHTAGGEYDASNNTYTTLSNPSAPLTGGASTCHSGRNYQNQSYIRYNLTNLPSAKSLHLKFRPMGSLSNYDKMCVTVSDVYTPVNSSFWANDYTIIGLDSTGCGTGTCTTLYHANVSLSPESSNAIILTMAWASSTPISGTMGIDLFDLEYYAPSPTTPATPSFTDTTPSENAIRLFWTYTSNGTNDPTYYKLYRSTSPGLSCTPSTLIFNTLDRPASPPSIPSHTDYNLAFNTTYYYRVQGGNPSGEGTCSAEVNETTEPFTPIRTVSNDWAVILLKQFDIAANHTSNFTQPTYRQVWASTTPQADCTTGTLVATIPGYLDRDFGIRGTPFSANTTWHISIREFLNGTGYDTCTRPVNVTFPNYTGIAGTAITATADAWTGALTTGGNVSNLTYTNNSPPTWDSGGSGGHRYYNDSDSYIHREDSSGVAAWTAAFWLNTQDTVNQSDVLYLRRGDNTNPDVRMGIVPDPSPNANTARMECQVGSSSATTTALTATSVVLANVWQHWTCIVRAGSGVQLFLNGTLVASNTPDRALSGSDLYPLSIGTRRIPTDDQRPVKGNITDARLWTRGISNLEVPGVYNGTYTNATPQSIALPSELTVWQLYRPSQAPSNNSADAPILTATGASLRAELSWTNVPQADRYNVWYSNTNITPAQPMNGTGYTWYGSFPCCDATVAGLTAGTEYWFVVGAANSFGEGYPSIQKNATPTEDTESLPLNLDADGELEGIQLSWDPPLIPSGLTGYKIYRSIEDNTTFSLLATIGTNTTYLDAEAERGFEYYYCVKATYPAGDSSCSNEAHAHIPQSLVGEDGLIWGDDGVEGAATLWGTSELGVRLLYGAFLVFPFAVTGYGIARSVSGRNTVGLKGGAVGAYLGVIVVSYMGLFSLWVPLLVTVIVVAFIIWRRNKAQGGDE